jgi:hypothetical protein
MSVALVAAPCKNCGQKPVNAETQKCKHDCCPKPKPEKADCKWQPADYAAVEAKQELQSVPQTDSASVAADVEVFAWTSETVLAPRGEAEPPPLYLSHHQFRN